LASNKHLNNTIRVYQILYHFEKKVRKERKTTERSKSNLNGNDIKKSFSKPIIKGVTTIYKRNKKKLVIGVEEKICL